MSTDMKSEKKPENSNTALDDDVSVGSAGPVIYIDPEKERAAFEKFDKYVIPVSVVFMVLSSLDRNNVSRPLDRSYAVAHSFSAWQCPSVRLR